MRTNHNASGKPSLEGCVGLRYQLRLVLQTTYPWVCGILTMRAYKAVNGNIEEQSKKEMLDMLRDNQEYIINNYCKYRYEVEYFIFMLSLDMYTKQTIEKIIILRLVPRRFFCGADFFWLFCILYIQLRKRRQKDEKEKYFKKLKKTG
jgi:hypothetical protein